LLPHFAATRTEREKYRTEGESFLAPADSVRTLVEGVLEK
jgi:hypothetical protein